jgi:agmatine deiminase
MSTPKELEFYMPAEWAEHKAIWMSWPYDTDTFPIGVEKVEKQYAFIFKTLAEHKAEKVNLFVRDESESKRVSEFLQKSGVPIETVNFWIQDYADVWIRDYGPTFLLSKDNKELGMINWTFNAWGDKYEELLKDDQIPSVINQKYKIREFNPAVVMEGGSIEVNGKGTVLTSRQCLLNKNRNPHLNFNQIEKLLSDYLNVSSIIWLNEGIVGDDTDGHIDDIARFSDEQTILYAIEEDPNNPNYEYLQENLHILKEAKDQDGKPFNLIALPMPALSRDEYHDKWLPASYLNFYIANKLVFLPIFGDAKDEEAVRITQSAFPKHKVIPVYARDWVHGNGSIHCSSQQEPVVVRR